VTFCLYKKLRTYPDGVSLRGRTPRSAFAKSKVSVCTWKSTPLIGGSVYRTLTFSSFPTRKARGVLHHLVPRWHSVFDLFYNSTQTKVFFNLQKGGLQIFSWFTTNILNLDVSERTHPYVVQRCDSFFCEQKMLGGY
jgi:hypothetical protein